ncbi:hypothetical protein [Streptomyces sp. NPDC006195]
MAVRRRDGGHVGGDTGNGSVTFFDRGNRLEGTAQFPDEGPVQYRGRFQD